AESIVRLGAPADAPKVPAFSKEVDEALGISLRNDFLAALGDQLVHYNSPAEGPFTLGQTFLFRVKDAPKLQSALNQIIKALAKLSGVSITVKRRSYHGVEIREVSVRQPGFILVPSYAIHKDWLVVGYFPQAVQGYILRATGELPVWKPDARVQAALD